MTPALPLLALLATGCGPSVRCESADQELAFAGGRALTCGQAGWVTGWIALLAGRPVPAAEERRALAATRDRWLADPPGASAWLEDLRRAGAALEVLGGFEGGERRAHLAWEARSGRGPITERDGASWSVQEAALSVWAHDDEEQLALTEMDVEGWIHLASWCREVQGGAALRISVADRVSMYRVLQERFDRATRAEQIAMVSVGPYWPRVREAWQAAPYARQQAWIAAAPLPPPMTASSLGYAEVVFQGDLVGLAASVHEVLGPFVLAAEGAGFTTTPGSP